MKWLVFFLFPVSLVAQPSAKDLEERIRKVENFLAPAVIYGDSVPHWNMEERMRATQTKGLSLAVIRNYKIEWAKGYGWADSAENRKVTQTTRFQAASISKSINSLGILKLADKGKLDPEADINQYLKTWKFPYDSLSKGRKISINNLLSHTAGLDIHGFPGYERGDTIPTLVQILNGERPANTRKVRSLFEPGTRFKYSGGGTTISQLLLMDLTGEDYATYMEREVLKPLGMKHSSYRQPPTDTADLSTGYYRSGKPVPGKYHIYPEQAAAGLWTTPSDLARYIIECQLALEGKSNKVLSTAMMKKRLTPNIDTTSGLGVFLEKKGGMTYFNHNGGNEAFLCTSYGSMKEGNGVVIMINGENFAIISEVLNSVAQVYDWKGFYNPSFKKIVPLPADSLNRYVGQYQLMQDTLIIAVCGSALCLRETGDMENVFTMIFSDYDHFSVREVPDADFTILRNADGTVDAIELKQRGARIRMPRLK